MTIAHTVYIPFALTVGFFMGWYFGSRAVRSEWERSEQRRRARDEGV